MWHRRKGSQAQATSENGILTVSVNFYVLPLDFLLCLRLTVFHILFFRVFVVFTDMMNYLEPTSLEIHNVKPLRIKALCSWILRKKPTYFYCEGKHKECQEYIYA